MTRKLNKRNSSRLKSKHRCGTVSDDIDISTASGNLRQLGDMSDHQNDTLLSLYKALEKRCERQQRTIEEQQRRLEDESTLVADMQNGIIEALITACEFKTLENADHMRRLGRITQIILDGTDFGDMSHEQVKLIALAATVHDIGKVAIPNHILEKPGELTPEEYDVIKTHTVKGAELLSDVEQLRRLPIYPYATDIARHHHERWDGHGYPDGLVGDEITPWAQVVSVADVYDALRSKRCYHEAFDAETAWRMICDGKCGTFNPMLLDAFSTVEREVAQIYDATIDIDASELLL